MIHCQHATDDTSESDVHYHVVQLYPLMILPEMSLNGAETGFSFSAAICEVIIKGLTHGKILDWATMIFFFLIYNLYWPRKVEYLPLVPCRFWAWSSIDSKYVILLGKRGSSKLIAF